MCFITIINVTISVICQLRECTFSQSQRNKLNTNIKDIKNSCFGLEELDWTGLRLDWSGSGCLYDNMDIVGVERRLRCDLRIQFFAHSSCDPDVGLK